MPRLAAGSANSMTGLHAKLAAVGLVQSRGDQHSRMGEFVEKYIAGRTDVTPRTRLIYHQAEKSLLGYFGLDRDLRSITSGGMEDWKRWMAAQGLAENTHRKRAARAKLFFGSAVRDKLIDTNPASTLKSHLIAVRERQRYVTPAEIAAVMDQADLTWKAILALCRFMALRCPSEVLEVRWCDVNWSTGRLTVRSSKTEHVGKGRRVVPLVPAARTALANLFDSLPEASPALVFDRYAGMKGNGTNLRTQLRRLCDRAGIEQPQKPFHNMRSSCVTDWAETLPSHAVCEFAGHTEAVSTAHYRQTLETHVDRLCQTESGAARNPARYTSELAGTGYHETTEPREIPLDSAGFEAIPVNKYTREDSNL